MEGDPTLVQCSDTVVPDGGSGVCIRCAVE